jgi:hypothetical protein
MALHYEPEGDNARTVVTTNNISKQHNPIKEYFNRLDLTLQYVPECDNARYGGGGGDVGGDGEKEAQPTAPWP